MQHLQWQFRYKSKRVFGGTLNSICQPSCEFRASSLQIRFTRHPTATLPYWHPESCDFCEFKIKAGRFGILREFAGNGSCKGHVQEQYSRDDIKRQLIEQNYVRGCGRRPNVQQNVRHVRHTHALKIPTGRHRDGDKITDTKLGIERIGINTVC